jgi:hypothetical protein
LSELVGSSLLAPLLLAAADRFTTGDRFFDHLAPLPGPQVRRPGRRLDALRRPDDLGPMPVERLDRRPRRQAEPFGEPSRRLRSGRARRTGGNSRPARRNLGRARLDRCSSQARRLGGRTAHAGHRLAERLLSLTLLGGTQVAQRVKRVTGH